MAAPRHSRLRSCHPWSLMLLFWVVGPLCQFVIVSSSEFLLLTAWLDPPSPPQRVRIQVLLPVANCHCAPSEG